MSALHARLSAALQPFFPSAAHQSRRDEAAHELLALPGVAIVELPEGVSAQMVNDLVTAAGFFAAVDTARGAGT